MNHCPRLADPVTTVLRTFEFQPKASAHMKPRKKNFSSFDANSALRMLGIDELQRWEIQAPPYHPGPFLAERLRRLEHFDLTGSEAAKELLIDALCEEAIVNHPRLKIWKAAPLQSEDLTGCADYLVTPKKAYLTTPLLCIVEAKKDDFEKGMAQCLVEMQACRWNNREAEYALDVYGVVSNGRVWQFYKLTPANQVFETQPFSLGNLENVLTALEYVFRQCEDNLSANPAT